MSAAADPIPTPDPPAAPAAMPTPAPTTVPTAAPTAGPTAALAVRLRIRRQAGPDAAPCWQSFDLAARPGDSVLALLMALRERPVTSTGERVAPVAFEANCMEEVCGACAMLINGRPRPSCSALIGHLVGGGLIGGGPAPDGPGPVAEITLAPLPKFPLVRDLLVDRGALFAHLRTVRAWVETDGPWDLHERAPRVSPAQWAADYRYSRCMHCGCCAAACPQFDARPASARAFVGPAALAQVRLVNAHPLGQFDRSARLHAIMGAGGLSDCGNAQNCVRVCPMEIPLTTAIGELGRATTVQALRDLFGG